MKTIKIKGKEYVMVVERLKYLANEKNQRYSIETFPTYMPDLNCWFVKAVLTIEDVGTFTGHATEVIGDGNINRTSAIENCETSAVGRACAMAGIGLIDDVASADEVIAASDATHGQLTLIEGLLESSTIDDNRHSIIESEYLSYSYDRAKKCINYLKDNQLRPIDRGNMSAKEINQAVTDAVNDSKK